MLKYTHRPGGSASCPQCQEPISRLANVCPHCRSDLSTNEQWQAQKPESSAGCASLLIFGVIGSGIAGVSVFNVFG